MSESYDDYLELAVELAKTAGKMMLETFHEEKSYDTKSNHADVCTETDHKVEKMVFDAVRNRFPHHKLIGEETAEAQAEGQKDKWTDDPTWIVDPVDGTVNFIHSHEYICISIGITVKKEVVVGVVYNPVKDEMYSAQIGKGAFCNGKPMQVSNTADLSRALVATECFLYPTLEQVDVKLNNMRAVVQKSHGIRGTGSCAMSMCLLARGVFDGHFEMGLHCWDMAAGALLITEAGGTVTDVGGGPLQLMSRRLVAGCNSTVASQLSALLTTADFEPDCLT